MEKLCFIFILFSFFIQGQNAPAIKIYLEDACSHKTVNKAKVTLEGFERPKIFGKYDKKGKFYYFESVPSGYKAIFVNHKKFDEAGFQLTETFPKKININLNCNGNIIETDTTYREV